MKFLMLFLSILFLATPSFAQRIMITKTSKKSNLKPIQKRLNSLRVKMYVQKTKTAYIIYSKDFTNKNEMNRALKRVKNYFPSAYIKQKKASKIAQKKDNIDYFVNISYLYSSLNVSTTGQDSITDTGSSYAVDLGFFFLDSFYCSLGYLRTSIENITIDTLLASLDYKYLLSDDINIYVGVLAGYGQLTLDVPNSTPSTSPAGGVEFGISYDITQHIPITLGYQGLYIGQKIVYSSATELDFNPLHNVKLAIGYKF